MMPSNIEEIGSKIYTAIASSFPVVSASDEFFYYPQVKTSGPDWRIWDRFSPDFIEGFVRGLSLWENEIDQLISEPFPSDAGKHSDADHSKIRVLKKVTQTLREHLDRTRVWETQPSFYLTITCLGLAEAMESGVSEARQRARTLPDFLDQAGRNLKSVPIIFRDISLEMIQGIRAYLIMLLPDLPELSSALKALDRFEQNLKALAVRSEFVFPKEQLARIIQTHINCGMDIQEANNALDLEIESITRVLEAEANHMGHDNWQAGYESIGLPTIGINGLVRLYRDEVTRLGTHFKEFGLVTDRFYRNNPVRVIPVPGYLSAIRATSSYSISPGHPPSGGTFYVINAHDPEEAKKDYNREYRILSAHETWPGHHLLDICRWSLKSPILRAVEQPVFYEGWACFAEEMLCLTGYVSDPEDRLIVAKRRLWRAIRGKVDLGLQTGTMTMAEAVSHLTRTGMTREQGWSSARKYLLNPGYQLCYTLGIRNFLSLFDRYGQNNLVKFSRIVLNQGEICFNDLERVLQKK